MMKDVPKEILRSMQKGLTSVIKLVQRGDKIRGVQNGGQGYAAPGSGDYRGYDQKGLALSLFENYRESTVSSP
jgi:hypothetical protein